MSNYDLEVYDNTKPYKFELFYKVHTLVTSFKTRSKLVGYIRVIVSRWLHGVRND